MGLAIRLTCCPFNPLTPMNWSDCNAKRLLNCASYTTARGTYPISGVSPMMFRSASLAVNLGLQTCRV